MVLFESQKGASTLGGPAWRDFFKTTYNKIKLKAQGGFRFFLTIADTLGLVEDPGLSGSSGIDQNPLSALIMVIRWWIWDPNYALVEPCPVL